jgi:hypothetical protein
MWFIFSAVYSLLHTFVYSASVPLCTYIPSEERIHFSLWVLVFVVYWYLGSLGDKGRPIQSDQACDLMCQGTGVSCCCHMYFFFNRCNCKFKVNFKELWEQYIKFMVTVFLNIFHLVFWRAHVYSHLSPQDGNKSVCKMCCVHNTKWCTKSRCPVIPDGEECLIKLFL